MFRDVLQLAVRSIPAWAGEPRSGPASAPLCRVYPRVGGGTITGGNNRFTPEGLSPRGRGNPLKK